MSTTTALVVASAVTSGLVGGVFYAFSTFVMAGLARPAPPVGLEAMQGINVTAPGPLLVLPLFGGPVVGIVAAVLAAGSDDVHAGWAIAGAVAFVVPAVMTVAFHVPRNDALDALDPAASGSAGAWERYCREWTAGNHVRTVAGLVAALAFTVSLVV